MAENESVARRAVNGRRKINAACHGAPADAFRQALLLSAAGIETPKLATPPRRHWERTACTLAVLGVLTQPAWIDGGSEKFSPMGGAACSPWAWLARGSLLVALLLAGAVAPALADGGASGGGGDGGITNTTTGGGAGGGALIRGGGGGGAGITGGSGGGSGDAGGLGGASAGASGLNGATSSEGGSGGGGGAHGSVVTVGATNAGSVTGGSGGAGGDSTGSNSGGGGAGGYGVVVSGAGTTYTNSGSGTITGGTGGSGGRANGAGAYAGNGGDGGIGIDFTGGGTLTNSGTIVGGSGGAGGAGFVGAVSGSAGAGGIGVVGSGLSVTNSGTIVGGLGGDGVTRADAIQFTGGTNTLTLQSGSTITGNVVAFSTADTLALGGSTNASFDVSQIGASAQYQGFGVFQKTGSSTWTLTGTTGATTPWTVSGGTLSISSDGNLGSGGTVALENGTTLAFTASGTYNHAITIAGDPAFDVASGQTVIYSTVIADGTSAGTLEKTGAGTLILTAANTYTGGTTVAAGTLSIGQDANLGNGGTLALKDGATLAITSGGTYAHALTIAGDTTFYKIASDTTVTWSGLISDGASPGNLVLNGGGGGPPFALTNTANSYSGSTTVENNGALEIDNAGELGRSTALNVDFSRIYFNSGATLSNQTITGTNHGGVLFRDTSTAGNATINLNDSGLTFEDSATAGSATINSDNAALYIYGNATAGNATISATDNTFVSFSENSDGGTAALNVDSTSSVDFSDSAGPAGDNKLRVGSISGAGAFYLGPDTLSVGGNNQSTLVSGVISDCGGGFECSNPGGSGTLVKVGTGTLTLTGANTYTGGTEINGGALNISADSGLGAAGTALSLNGGALQYGALFALDTTRAVTLGAGGGTFDTNGFSPAVGSAIGGSGALTKTGSGTLTLTGTNNYTGGTILTGGTLVLGNDAALGTGDLAMAAGTGLSFASGGNFTIANNISVAGDPTFNVDSGDTDIVSGVVSDASPGLNAGMVEKTGDGTLVLSGANTYSGGTTVAAGTLQLSGSGTLGAAGGMTAVSGGTLDLGGTTQVQNGGVTLTGGTVQNGTVSSSGTFALQAGTVGAVLAGAGGVDKTSSGTVTLAGTSTYTGGTTVSGGTLSISSDANLGNGGTVALEAGTMLAFTAGGTYAHAVTVAGDPGFDVASGQTVTYSGVIADGASAGTVEKTGGGTLVLTAANTYSGGTIVSGGTLQGDTTSLQGVITDNAALIFDQTTDGAYGGIISGTGTLAKTGNGGLILTGANSYTGMTTISAGTVTVMGSLAGPVTVNDGTLKGAGTVGAVNVTGGTLAPGDAIGTLHVNGDLTLAGGTTYAMEVSPGAADQTIATGAVTIANGTTLAITQDTGTYTASDYKLISAASVSGTFSTVTGDSFAGLNSMIQYSATGVDLILSVPPPPAPVTYLFGTYGKTPNEIAAGNAVTAGSPTGALYTSLGGVVTADTAQMPAALAQLSGDIHASLRSAALQDGRIIRDTIVNHAIAGTDTISVWATGFGAYGSVDSDGNAAAIHHNDAGVIMGADMPVAVGVNVGLAVALTGQTIKAPTESASASGTTNHAIGYANWTDGSWVASLGWDYGWGANQVTRRITTFPETDTDHQSNRLGQVFGGVGYRIPTDIVALEPYINFANVNVRTGAFTETGGAAALKGGAVSGTENYATFGVRATAPAISIGNIKMAAEFNLGWEHAFTRFLPGQALSFVGNGESFDVSGVPLGSDSAVIQAALDFALAPDAILSIGYDGALSGTAQEHAIRGGVSWKF